MRFDRIDHLAARVGVVELHDLRVAHENAGAALVVSAIVHLGLDGTDQLLLHFYRLLLEVKAL